MQHFVNRGNTIQLNWTLHSISGQEFSLSGHTYKLFFATGNQTNLATGVTHSGNVLSWTFTPNSQWKLGSYTLWIEVYDSGTKIVTVAYPDAFHLAHEIASTGTSQSGIQTESTTLNLVSSCDFYRFAPVMPVAGEDGYWYVNGVKAVDGNGEYILTSHTLEYDETTRNLIIDRGRVDSHGDSIEQIITALADLDSYYQAAEGSEEGSVAGDGSRWGSYKTAEATRNTASTSAEGTASSLAGDGSRWGSYKVAEAARETASHAAEGTAESEAGDGSRWGAFKTAEASRSSASSQSVSAANTAAERANTAAAAAELMVDIHQGPQGPAGVSPVVGGNGNWFEWDDETKQFVDTGKKAQGEVGPVPDFSIGSVTTGEAGTPASATITGTAAEPVLNLTIPQGIQGIQGNTGSSVAYPYELVNNLTTDDATKGLSAAQGKVLDGKVSQLEAEVNGENSEMAIEVTYSNGYIATNGVIGATSSPAYQHTDAIEITNDMFSLRCYALTGNSAVGGVGFYKTLPLPTSSAQATRTVEVVGAGTTSGSGNTLVQISHEKLEELKASGALYFSVCIDPNGTKGVSYIKYTKGIVNDLEDLDERIDTVETDMLSLEQDTNAKIEDLIVLEDEVTNYGLYTTTLNDKYYDENGILTDWVAYDSTSLALLDRENDIYPYFTGALNYVVFFDKDKTFISRSGGYKNNNPVLKSSFPVNAKYVAFSWVKGDLLSDVFATRNAYLPQMGWKVYCGFKKKKGTRPSVDILPTDSQGSVLVKLCSAYIAGDCDVRFNFGEYNFQSIYTDMVDTYQVGSVQGSWQRELPLGRNCTYNLCNSTITGSYPEGITDGKVFGNMRQPGENFTLFNGKIVNNGMAYAIHDEGQNSAGFYKHEYKNLEIVNAGGVCCLGLGTGISGVVNIDKCIFLDNSTNSCIGGHGITDSSVTDDAVFELNITNCWLSTSANVTTLGVNQSAKFVMSGCSVKSLYNASTWDKYFFANEIRP